MGGRIEDIGGHWVWVGASDIESRGIIMVRGRRQYVHRVLWEAHNGTLPSADEGVLKKICDIEGCVKPDCWIFLRFLPRANPIGTPPEKCARDHYGAYVVNSQGYWACKLCARERNRARYVSKRAEVNAVARNKGLC